jgi:hypothetical protein
MPSPMTIAPPQPPQPPAKSTRAPKPRDVAQPFDDALDQAVKPEGKSAQAEKPQPQAQKVEPGKESAHATKKAKARPSKSQDNPETAATESPGSAPAKAGSDDCDPAQDQSMDAYREAQVSQTVEDDKADTDSTAANQATAASPEVTAQVLQSVAATAGQQPAATTPVADQPATTEASDTTAPAEGEPDPTIQRDVQAIKKGDSAQKTGKPVATSPQKTTRAKQAQTAPTEQLAATSAEPEAQSAADEEAPDHTFQQPEISEPEGPVASQAVAKDAVKKVPSFLDSSTDESQVADEAVRPRANPSKSSTSASPASTEATGDLRLPGMPFTIDKPGRIDQFTDSHDKPAIQLGDAASLLAG